MSRFFLHRSPHCWLNVRKTSVHRSLKAQNIVSSPNSPLSPVSPPPCLPHPPLFPCCLSTEKTTRRSVQLLVSFFPSILYSLRRSRLPSSRSLLKIQAFTGAVKERDVKSFSPTSSSSFFFPLSRSSSLLYKPAVKVRRKTTTKKKLVVTAKMARSFPPPLKQCVTDLSLT